MAELLNSLDRNVVLGMAQAAAAIALCFGVVMLCRRFAVHVERETVISLARGLVQMVAVGVVLALLLHGKFLSEEDGCRVVGVIERDGAVWSNDGLPIEQ